MKILHITDSHGTVKSPEGRKDIYYITFLKKLYELGFVCKQCGINMVIHTGDLFHTARVSNKFAGQVSEMIKAMGVDFYVVPGNHDIEGYTTDTIDQTMLGLLAKTGVVHLLDREHPVSVIDTDADEEYTIAISGQEYYAHIDEGNMKDFEMQQDEADLNILCIHGYIADTPQHPDIKCTMVQDIITDADIILTGHYHRQFEWSGADVDIYNPGSMMRVEQTEYNKTHTPQYGILQTGIDANGDIVYDYKFYDFRVAQPSTVVFDYDSKYKQKIASITLDGFKNSLANTMATLSPTSDIIQIITDLCAKNNIDKQIETLTIKAYNDTLQKIPDEFEAPPGYIEAQQPKKIKAVRLRNFQSHKDTYVEFSDGLNIIVGESNNGKTAIIRGIMWAIDNQPLGTDFIMAGQKDCIVRIEYDDGTYIERGRNTTDTGYYQIGYFDENGALQDATYRGFTNAIPVEVINTHQMPKVNITKDIETHLNVLSQLDAPFLLTESPQVKAAAIGRITGTHVIDAAVKDANKEIRNNKVLLKDIEKDLKETEFNLTKIPDVSVMEKVLMAYNSVIANIKALSFTIEKLTKHQKELSDIETESTEWREKYAKYSVLKSLKRLVDVADKQYTEVSLLDTRMHEYADINSRTALLTDSLEINKGQASLSPMITHAIGVLSFVQTASSYVGEKKMIEVQEGIEEKSRKLNSAVAGKMKAVVMYAERLNQEIKNTGQLLIDYKSTDDSVTDTTKTISGYKKQLKVFEKQIQSVEKDKLKAILDNGICPCCGQPVTSEEYAQHVNAFMGGQKIG